jgi:CRISPR/Cas system endoribonuclease Cas6 (RAMP superfamily)
MKIASLEFFTVPLEFAGDADQLRGELGRQLFGSDLYRLLFAPPRRMAGPSGLADPPRPFVLRQPDRLYVFDLSLAPHFDASTLRSHTVSLAERAGSITGCRLEFLSPTFLRTESFPEFGPLFCRLRDRIANLSALYGSGPLDLPFRELTERSHSVQLASHRLEEVRRERLSRSTGQRHPYGGFVGEAVYEGDLTPFAPFLEAGYYTGVGKHTAWGNGWIRAQLFPPARV